MVLLKIPDVEEGLYNGTTAYLKSLHFEDKPDSSVDGNIGVGLLICDLDKDCLRKIGELAAHSKQWT